MNKQHNQMHRSMFLSLFFFPNCGTQHAKQLVIELNKNCTGIKYYFKNKTVKVYETKL